MTQYLTTSEAAARLRCSRRMVCELIQRGEIKTRRLGRQYRIPEDALDMPEVEAKREHMSKRVRAEIAAVEAWLEEDGHITQNSGCQ